MISRLLGLFQKGSSQNETSCSEQIAELQQQNQELRKELIKRQEAINKTNAYWKGVVRKLRTGNVFL